MYFVLYRFIHLLGSLYSEFNLWQQLHSTQQQKPILLIQQRHKSSLFASESHAPYRFNV